jgi:hypothetical protein
MSVIKNTCKELVPSLSNNRELPLESEDHNAGRFRKRSKAQDNPSAFVYVPVEVKSILVFSRYVRGHD